MDDGLGVDAGGIVAREFGLGSVVSFRRTTAGIMNLNWCLITATGTYAVKLIRDATPEQVRLVQDVLPAIAGLGVAVPIARRTRTGEMLLRIGDDRYTVFDWLSGSHPREGELSLDGCAAFGDLVDRLAAGEIAWRLGLLAEVGDQRPVDGEAGPAGWTHGDLQPFNLLAADGRVTGVLDWDRLGVRTYGLEVVRTATITFGTGAGDGLDLTRVAAFAGGYRVHVEITDAELADAAHRRWWSLATDVWPLDRHYDRGDRTCDEIFDRRSRFLRWWTAHRADVTAALTRR